MNKVSFLLFVVGIPAIALLLTCTEACGSKKSSTPERTFSLAEQRQIKREIHEALFTSDLLLKKSVKLRDGSSLMGRLTEQNDSGGYAFIITKFRNFPWLKFEGTQNLNTEDEHYLNISGNVSVAGQRLGKLEVWFNNEPTIHLAVDSSFVALEDGRTLNDLFGEDVGDSRTFIFEVKRGESSTDSLTNQASPSQEAEGIQNQEAY